MDTNESTPKLVPTREELMFEYEQLRQEILHNENLSNQILGGVLVLVSVLMGFAFGETVPNFLVKASLFFLAAVIAGVGFWESLERERSTFVIASYLRVFVESKTPGLKWETRLEKFRVRSHKAAPLLPYYINYQLFTYLFLIALNFLLSGGYVLYVFHSARFFSVVIVITFCSTILILWLIRKAWRLLEITTINYEKTFLPIWEKIKDEEELSYNPKPHV